MSLQFSVIYIPLRMSFPHACLAKEHWSDLAHILLTLQCRKVGILFHVYNGLAFLWVLCFGVCYFVIFSVFFFYSDLFCLFACWFSNENDRKGVCLSGWGESRNSWGGKLRLVHSMKKKIQ